MNIDPLSLGLLIFAAVCGLISAYFLGLALRIWARDRAAAKAQAEFEAEYPCPKCREGLAELVRYTCDGAWICPRCGRPHLLADGKPINGIDVSA